MGKEGSYCLHNYAVICPESALTLWCYVSWNNNSSNTFTIKQQTVPGLDRPEKDILYIGSILLSSPAHNKLKLLNSELKQELRSAWSAAASDVTPTPTAQAEHVCLISRPYPTAHRELKQQECSKKLPKRGAGLALSICSASGYHIFILFVAHSAKRMPSDHSGFILDTQDDLWNASVSSLLFVQLLSADNVIWSYQWRAKW